MTKSKKMNGGQPNQNSVQSNNITDTTESNTSTFILSQPLNLLFFMSFFSPIILVILITSMSFLFQNWKGIIYLGFVLAVVIVRRYILEYTGAKQLVPDGTICTAVQFSKYGNITLSLFIFAFTLMYLCIPMFYNSSVNWIVFSSLLFYIFVDIGIKFFENCLSFEKNGSIILMDLLAGMSLGVLITSIMSITNNQKYLFFNEVQSNKEVCSMPKKQSFKCALYKNGELVTS
jgi:hypothetical protein